MSRMQAHAVRVVVGVMLLLFVGAAMCTPRSTDAARPYEVVWLLIPRDATCSAPRGIKGFEELHRFAAVMTASGRDAVEASQWISGSIGPSSGKEYVDPPEQSEDCIWSRIEVKDKDGVAMKTYYVTRKYELILDRRVVSANVKPVIYKLWALFEGFIE